MSVRVERSRDTHRRSATPRGISTSLDANGSGGGGRNRSPPLSPQYLRHRLPLGEFVDQLVEIAQLAHQRLFDSLDTDAANHPRAQRPRRVELRRRGKDVLESRALRQLRLKRRLTIARQPEENRVDLGPGAPLLQFEHAPCREE